MRKYRFLDSGNGASIDRDSGKEKSRPLGRLSFARRGRLLGEGDHSTTLILARRFSVLASSIAKSRSAFASTTP